MKTKMLLSHSWRKIGWIILVPSIVLSVALSVTDWEQPALYLTVPSFFNDSHIFNEAKESSAGIMVWTKDNFTNELISIGLLVGLFLVAFSKEKIEDEYIFQLRLNALLWSVYITRRYFSWPSCFSTILLLCTFFSFICSRCHCFSS